MSLARFRPVCSDMEMQFLYNFETTKEELKVNRELMEMNAIQTVTAIQKVP